MFLRTTTILVGITAQRSAGKSELGHVFGNQTAAFSNSCVQLDHLFLDVINTLPRLRRELITCWPFQATPLGALTSPDSSAISFNFGLASKPEEEADFWIGSPNDRDDVCENCVSPVQARSCGNRL